MKKVMTLILVLVGLAAVVVAVLFLIGVLRSKEAGIYVETNPEAQIFIDDVLAGKTPYKETIKPDEMVIKLVPESFDKPLVPYEAKVKLVSGVETIIKWDFGESDEESSGEIVSFEKVAGDETSMAIVTIPDSSQVIVDSDTRAFAPYKTSTLNPGEHMLVVSADGYKERSIRIKTHKGYKLTAIVKLAQDYKEEVAQEENEQEEAVKIKEFIKILSTPTGFLRVREEPSTLGEEITQVKPGEKYPFIEEDENTGWFKIEYEEGEEGWVSNTYSEKIEEEASLTPTPKEE